MKQNDELESYKDAVWDFILEHCDLTERGSFFVKFHVSDRRNFENRIKARWKYGYHRIDDRTGFDHRQKEKDANARKQAHLDAKKSKQYKHILSRERQREAMEKLRIERERRERLANMSPLFRVIHSLFMQPLAQKWYNKITSWQKNRAQNNRQ